MRASERPVLRPALATSAALLLGALLPSSALAMSCDTAGKFLLNYERLCREQPRYCGDVPVARAQKNDACRAQSTASAEPAPGSANVASRSAPSSGSFTHRIDNAQTPDGRSAAYVTVNNTGNVRLTCSVRMQYTQWKNGGSQDLTYTGTILVSPGRENRTGLTGSTGVAGVSVVPRTYTVTCNPQPR